MSGVLPVSSPRPEVVAGDGVIEVKPSLEVESDTIESMEEQTCCGVCCTSFTKMVDRIWQAVIEAVNSVVDFLKEVFGYCSPKTDNEETRLNEAVNTAGSKEAEFAVKCKALLKLLQAKSAEKYKEAFEKLSDEEKQKYLDAVKKLGHECELDDLATPVMAGSVSASILEGLSSLAGLLILPTE